jgi:hypothetical protein
MRCPFCQTNNFTLSDGQVQLVVSEMGSTQYIVVGQLKTLPSIALVCQHCGNTLLLNMIVLGLGDLMRSLTQDATEKGA